MPTDKFYEGRVIRPWEYIDEDGKMEGFTFEDCTIRGPAIFVLQECTVSNSTLRGDADAILWEIPLEKKVVIGPILATRCTFEKCIFENIGFAGPPAFIEEIRKGSGLS